MDYLPYLVLGVSVALIVAALFSVVRHRLYVQALIVLALGGAITCFIKGIKLLTDSQTENETAGAILTVGGVALLLATAVVTWWIYKRGRPS